jgi:Right handed beta helix region
MDMLRTFSLFLTATSVCLAPSVSALTYYASPQGQSGHAGTSATAPLVLASALLRLQAGDSLILAPSTYAIPYVADEKNTLTLSAQGTASKPITVLADSTSPGASAGRIAYAVLDFSFPEQQWVQDSYGLLVSGSHWKFTRIAVTRAGYQGVYVTGSHNTFDRCAFYDNRNSGLEINKGGAYTTVMHCDAYRNYDPKKSGSMADGFAPKQTQGPGNRFVNCRAWENSDDGYDTYDSPDSVVFEHCWAFRNGVDIWQYGGFTGNGNGFKAGGNQKLANNRLTHCIAFDHPQKGFDQNNNTGGITLLNNLAYRNGTNFGLSGGLAAGQKHVLRNCISLGASDAIANAIQDHNSWNTGFAISSSDFASLDTSLATAPRLADGSLRVTSLFRLKPQSRFIDAGVDVGLPFTGQAPDLGAFEALPEGPMTALQLRHIKRINGIRPWHARRAYTGSPQGRVEKHHAHKPE